jgi:ethanolamine-phosphate cytidylyltransferase
MDGDILALFTNLQIMSDSVARRRAMGFFLPSLKWMGISADRLPSMDLIACTIAICASSLIGTLYHWRQHRQLQRELRKAQAKLDYLQEKLQSPSNSDDPSKEKKEIRIFMDGAFDLLHFGHMNAFRLARSLGSHLIVGVNSDASITECKGAPLMTDDERLTMVSCCKFVDEVVPDCPYIMNEEYLHWAIERYQIDYVIHGDDPCIVDGKDVYAAAKEAGKFRTIPRTTGVSTTDIVGRMLLLTKDHHYHDETPPKEEFSSDGEIQSSGNVGKATPATTKTTLCSQTNQHQLGLGHQSKFLTTSRMLQLFSADVKAPTSDMRVVYIDGDWDLFHPGHVAELKAAREVGIDFCMLDSFLFLKRILKPASCNLICRGGTISLWVCWVMQS